MTHKQDVKDLKKPDEFQAASQKAMGWLLEQRTLVLGLGVAVVALVIGLWAVSAWSASRDRKAGALLSEAMELMSRGIAGEGTPTPGQETFPSKEARTQATVAALEKVRGEFADSPAGRTATAQLGFVKLKAGDTAGAQTLLAEYIAKAGKTDALLAVALSSLGSALEQQGKLDEAKATYAKLTEAGAPERAAYEQARLLLAQNKPEAKAELEKVAKEFSKQGVAMDAQRRLELAALPPLPPPGSTPAPEAAPAPTKKPAKAPAPKKKG